MANLQIRCLGGLSIYLDHEPLSGFHSRKSRALLCYLAVTGNAYPRSALAGLLWPDLPEANARANLRKVLSNLRQLVGPFLAASRDEVWLEPGNTLWVDINQFENCLVPGARIEQVESAVDLYDGDFLYGFEISGAPDFEVWVLSQRARLREMAVEALDRLAANAASLGNAVRAISHLKELLSIEPWREETHRQLITLLAQTGQRSAALVQCERCRQLLWQELGVEPAEKTKQLCDALRRDQLDTHVPIAPTTAPGETEIKDREKRHNLPPQLTPFIGRAEELTLLAELLHDPDARLITIVGAGGMGKTRLALAAAEAHIDHFEDGVHFVSLAPLQDVEAIVPAIAQALDFALSEGGSTLEKLTDYLRRKNLLLVLDNFEHLVDDAQIVAAILRHAPGIKALITSRTKLRLHGEYLLHIDGMTTPHPETCIDVRLAGDAQAYDAVNLFMQSARRSRPDYAWTADDGHFISTICHLTEGMPLGIILAAAWMEMLSPQEIAGEVKRSLDFLQSELRDVPDRHKSIRAVFESSRSRLSAEEQEIFTALSVFRGGFTQHAAQVVAGASPGRLLALANKSLLNRTENGRYVVHELLRQYAFGHLSRSSSRFQSIRDRHSAYYCAAMQELAGQWKAGQEVAAFAAIETDFENVRAAWRWAAKRGRYDWLDQAMESFGEAFSWLARYQEGRAAFAEAKESLEAFIVTHPDNMAEAKLVLAKLLIWQGEFDREFLGRHQRAEQLFNRSQDLLRQAQESGLDTRRDEALLLVQLARIARDKGDHDLDDRYWQKSLRLSLELEDEEWIAYKIGGNAWDAYRKGTYDEAQRLFEQAVAMWHTLGNTMYLTNLLGGLGVVALAQGRLEESERLLRKSMDMDKARGRVDKLVNLYALLGQTLFFNGKFAVAHGILNEGVDFYLETGRRERAKNVQSVLAEVLFHMGQYDQARELAQEVHTYWKSVDLAISVADSLILPGKLALAEGEYVEAQRLLAESVEMFRQFGGRGRIGHALAFHALAQLELYQTESALRCAAEALQSALHRQSFTLLITLLPLAAAILAAVGHTALAARIVSLAYSYPFIAQSRCYMDVVGRTLEAADLSLEQGIAAPEPAAVNELWKAAAEAAYSLETLSHG